MMAVSRSLSALMALFLMLYTVTQVSAFRCVCEFDTIGVRPLCRRALDGRTIFRAQIFF